MSATQTDFILCVQGYAISCPVRISVIASMTLIISDKKGCIMPLKTRVRIRVAINITLFSITAALAWIFDPEITSIFSIIWILGLFILYHIIILRRASVADVTEESFKSSLIILQHLCMVAVLGVLYYTVYMLRETDIIFLLPESILLAGARVLLVLIVVALFYRIRHDVYSYLVSFWDRR